MPRSRENENARKRVVTGRTRDLKQRHTNGEGMESGLLHRDDSEVLPWPKPGDGDYVQLRYCK